MTNETLRDKISSAIWRAREDGEEWSDNEIADAILATIKADDDAKDKRIEELEALVQKLASDPDYTAAYMAGVADQKATLAELEKMIDNMTAHIRIDPDD